MENLKLTSIILMLRIFVACESTTKVSPEPTSDPELNAVQSNSSNALAVATNNAEENAGLATLRRATARYHYPNPWPQDASDFSVSLHAKDLVAFIQTLDLGKVHLIGHSYGALTALLVVRNNPELVRSLTLGEPPAMSLLVSSSQGNSLFQNFMESSITPSHNAFEKGNIEDGVRLFINGVLGEGAYEKLPPIAHIFMLENAWEMKGEIRGINAKGVDFFPSFSCKGADQLTMPALLLDRDNESAFAWLDKAFEVHSVMLGWGIGCSSEFELLHKDPRWKKNLQKINLAKC